MDWPLIKKEEPVDFIFEYESIDFESKNDFQMLADKIKEKRTTEYDSYESGSIVNSTLTFQFGRKIILSPSLVGRN